MPSLHPRVSAFKGAGHHDAPASQPSKRQGLQTPSRLGLGFQRKQAIASPRILDGVNPLDRRHPCLCPFSDTRPPCPSPGFPGRAPRPPFRPSSVPSILAFSFCSWVSISLYILPRRLNWHLSHVSASHMGTMHVVPGALGNPEKVPCDFVEGHLCFNLREMQGRFCIKMYTCTDIYTPVHKYIRILLDSGS